MSSQRIFIYTLLVHGFWLLLFSLGGWDACKPKKEKMVVVTKEFVKPKPIPKPVATIIKPIPKTQATASLPKKIPAPKKKVVKAKKAPPAPKQLLKKIDQTLTKIENPVPKTVTAPTPVSDLPITFFDRVCHIFQETLRLPENGAVKLTLSVQPNGKIVIIELIHSENETNWQYLKLMLPMITLPPPQGGVEQTFMITFCND